MSAPRSPLRWRRLRLGPDGRATTNPITPPPLRFRSTTSPWRSGHLGGRTRSPAARRWPIKRRRQRFRAARPRVPLIARDGGVTAALRPYEAVGRSLQVERPAAGRGDQRIDERRWYCDEGEHGPRFAAPTGQARHHRDMIAYRQAREKLIERSRPSPQKARSGAGRAMPNRSPFDSIATSRSSITASATARTCSPGSTSQHRQGHYRAEAHAGRAEHFKKAGSGVLVYLRGGAGGGGVPVAPLPEENSAEADRNKHGASRCRGADPARFLCHLDPSPDVISARHKGLSGFRHRDRLQWKTCKARRYSFRDDSKSQALDCAIAHREFRYYVS